VLCYSLFEWVMSQLDGYCLDILIGLDDGCSSIFLVGTNTFESSKWVELLYVKSSFSEFNVFLRPAQYVDVDLPSSCLVLYDPMPLCDVRLLCDVPTYVLR
jgi:hypothetical protein